MTFRDPGQKGPLCRSASFWEIALNDIQVKMLNFQLSSEIDSSKSNHLGIKIYRVLVQHTGKYIPQMNNNEGTKM